MPATLRGLEPKGLLAKLPPLPYLSPQNCSQAALRIANDAISPEVFTEGSGIENGACSAWHRLHPRACSLVSRSFFTFFGRAWPRKQGPYRLWPRSHRWHTPPHSPQRSQTEAFHGFKSSIRSSSHRRLEWVTESYSS